MPELPEVETTMRSLIPHLQGHKLQQLILRRRDLRWPIPDHFEDVLQGATIQSLTRRAKYMLWQLDNGYSVIVHLGMSGSMRVTCELPSPLKKHDHLALQTEQRNWIIYHDPRRFGAILLHETENLAAHPLLCKLGPEPLDRKRFTATYLHASLKRRNIAIKQAIMQAHIVVGVGNIYASEALFLAKIHPLRPASELTAQQCEILVRTIRQVLQAALKSGGSTLRDYVHANGDTGYFQHQFNVYDRANQPCTNCHGTISKRVLGARATYFCQNCQR
jgi:formamidopyrimidine-DNA glycosylase